MGCLGLAPSPMAKSIGLVNVARRLRLQFGASANLSAEGALGEGTRMSVRIPRRWEGNHPFDTSRQYLQPQA